MAFTFNGIGTKYYGTRWEPDGTYITTKWIVVLFVPIIPVESVRIVKAGPANNSGIYASQDLSTQSVPLDIGMMLRVYGVVLACILFLVYGVPFLNHLADGLKLR